MLVRLGLFGLFVGLVFAAAAQDRPVPVDLELAFVVDQSGSIDEAETMLQRQGYARAITDPVCSGGSPAACCAPSPSPISSSRPRPVSS